MNPATITLHGVTSEDLLSKVKEFDAQQKFTVIFYPENSENEWKEKGKNQFLESYSSLGLIKKIISQSYGILSLTFFSENYSFIPINL